MSATEDVPSGGIPVAPGSSSARGDVTVTVGPSGDAPVASSNGNEHTILRWWAPLAFALTVAFFAGASFWQTRANADAIKEVRGDVKQLLKLHAGDKPNGAR